MLTKILSLKKEEKKILAALAFPHTYTFHFRQVSYRCVVLSSTSRQGRRRAAHCAALCRAGKQCNNHPSQVRRKLTLKFAPCGPNTLRGGASETRHWM